ncbi:MAG: hypothetical protein WBD40_17560 [Tepidisphaeraceae bacterium]
MEHSDLQRYVVGVLERLDVPYFITGSTATIFFGEPRFTNDLDVVADLTTAHVPHFLAAFAGDDFYVSEDAVRAAINSRGQFNIIHPTSGLKVDVMLPKNMAVDRNRLLRRVRVHPADDYQAWFSSPEDIILKKMDFYREGESEKHLRDIASVMKIRGEKIDRAYISQWAATLGLQEIWDTILRRVDG